MIDAERLTLTRIDEAVDRATAWLSPRGIMRTVDRADAMALDVLSLADEARRHRVEDIVLDDYEAANLLWLLRTAKRINLDTGDWHKQVTAKLEARGANAGPNAGPVATEQLLQLAHVAATGNDTRVWVWRAWNKDKSRICDCGTVNADSAQQAHTYALACLGGPYLDDVRIVEVRAIARYGGRCDPETGTIP